ncbi:hypothetical protein AWB79_05730 [Caballeronia hypogeia]|uniref:Lipoprotein n=1 Tax=Caballeronia hypogeia TaxID=1777140 RepID=A0A158CPC8_9BURK|nr:hypothetical protein [Caballeronia hypogeia]SAK84178.1 hypothetical protein AWB79_05730 [Caballeronia hypogeia]
MKASKWLLVLLATVVPSLYAFADDAASSPKPAATLEKNNSWSFSSSDRAPTKFVYVVIRKNGNHWDVERVTDRRPTLNRNDEAEPFLVSSDFQQWTNYFSDNIINCNSFEAEETSEKTVCTSAFRGNKVAMQVFRILFGNNPNAGKTPVGYDVDKTTAAIQSIRPEQATQKLDAFEHGEVN